MGSVVETEHRYPGSVNSVELTLELLDHAAMEAGMDSPPHLCLWVVQQPARPMSQETLSKDCAKAHLRVG